MSIKICSVVLTGTWLGLNKQWGKGSKFHFILFVFRRKNSLPIVSSRLFRQPDLLEQVVTVDDNLDLPIKPLNIFPNFI
jgi:hypothetical protein